MPTHDDDYYSSDEYLNSYEYMWESSVNGQQSQARRIAERNNYGLREFCDWAAEKGYSDSEVLRAVRVIYG